MKCMQAIGKDFQHFLMRFKKLSVVIPTPECHKNSLTMQSKQISRRDGFCSGPKRISKRGVRPCHSCDRLVNDGPVNSMARPSSGVALG